MGKFRWTALAVLVTLIVALAGCGGDSSTDASAGGDDSANESTTTVAATAASSTAPPAAPSTETETEETTPPEPAVFAPDAERLTQAFVPVEPGTYRVDTVGTPFSFTVDEAFFVQPNGRGVFVLTHPGSNGPDDRDVVVLRVSALFDPSLFEWPFDDFDNVWPADDFSGWLDNAPGPIVVSNRQETTLGGLDGIYVELELGETDCSRSQPCTGFITNHGIGAKDLSRGSKYRVWILDQGDEDPLAVVAGIARDTDIEWFESADAMISTMAFGDVEPNPVFAASETVELAFLGGIQTEIEPEGIVVQEIGGFGAIAVPGIPADAEFLFAPNDMNGNPVETVESLLAVLEDARVEVTELDAAEIDGFPARVFDIGIRRSSPLFTRTANSAAVWTPPPRGRLWVVEHPERGLLVVTAEAFAEPDEFFPPILAMSENLVETMEFIELE